MLQKYIFQINAVFWTFGWHSLLKNI